MLVERRRNGMPAQAVLRVALVWAAISILLLFVNLGAIATRPLAELDDTFRLIPLLSPIIGSESSQIITLIAVPLLTIGVAMLLAARIAWRLIGEREAVMACLAMALSAPLLFQMGPLQVSQNGWQVVCALIAVNGLVSRKPITGGWITGIALAVWFAITLDGWPFAVSIFVIAAVKWLRSRADREWLVCIAQAMAVGSIAIYLGTKGVADPANYSDRMSPVHIAMLCWAALVLSALSRAGPIPSGALLGGFSLAGGGAIGIFALGLPIPVFQAQPIWQGELGHALETVTLPLLGIFAALQLASRNPDWLRRWWFDYALLLALMLALTIVTGRAAAIAAALAAVPLGWQLRLWLDHIGRIKNPFKRAFALTLLAAVLMPSLSLKLAPLIDSANARDSLALNSAALALALPQG